MKTALAALLLAFARTASAAPGSTAANFLKVGVGARPVSLGETYTAVADDVHAIVYNPAGLALLQRQEVSMMHNKFLPGIHQQFAAYAFPSVRVGTFAGAFTMLTVRPFDAYSKFDQPDGKVSAQDFAASGAWARTLPGLKGASLGVAGKFISSRLATYSAQAGALDAGLLYRPDEENGLTFGVAIRNLGSPMKFINEQFQLPVSGHVGFSYRAGGAPLWDDASWMFTAEGVGTKDRDPYATAGLEFRPVAEFSMRAGYRMNQDEGLGVAAGIGFTSLEGGFVPDWFPELTLDYAFVDYGRLENSHRVSVSFKFGVPKTERREGADRTPPKFHHLIKY